MNRMTDPAGWSVADPFDLPEWVGAEQLRWSTGETKSTALISGRLAGESGESLGLDLLCVDVAYPAAVVDERRRHDAHQAWHFGQVLLLVNRDGRLAMAVPTMPSDDWQGGSISVEGHESDGPDGTYPAMIHAVSPAYFEVLGIPIEKGRAFNRGDAKSNAVIVSKAMAEQQWPGEDPLGKRLKTGPRTKDTPWLIVVGVAVLTWLQA